jgi:hypothetical protein
MPKLVKFENKPAPEPNVIEALTHWLERAKAGEIQGLVLLGFCGDGDTTRASAGTMLASDVVTLSTVVAHEAIDKVRHDETVMHRNEPDGDDDQ